MDEFTLDHALNPCLTKLDIREAIDEMAKRISEEMEPGEIPTAHYHTPKVYTREVMIPAGTVLVGKIHRFECLNVVIGDITVLTEDGVRRITGYETFPSKPGTRRVGFTHSDTIWLNIHSNPDDLKDLDELECKLISPSYEDSLGITGEELQKLMTELGDESWPG